MLEEPYSEYCQNQKKSVKKKAETVKAMQLNFLFVDDNFWRYFVFCHGGTNFFLYCLC